jgi:hypothetical protein
MACNSCNKSLKDNNSLNWQPLNESIIVSIRNQIENYKSLETNIVSMVTCTGTSKTVGDIVHLSAQPSGGMAPYKVTFTKDSGALGSQIINVAKNQLVTYDYPTVSGDISTTAHVFAATTIDSCATGAKTNTESCNVMVSAVPCPTPVLTMTTVPATMTQGTSLPVTLTQTTVGTGPFLYEIYINDVEYTHIVGSTLSSWTTGDITWSLIGTHTIYGKVTDSCASGALSAVTATQTVVVSAAPVVCNIPACNLIVT